MSGHAKSLLPTKQKGQKPTWLPPVHRHESAVTQLHRSRNEHRAEQVSLRRLIGSHFQEEFCDGNCQVFHAPLQTYDLLEAWALRCFV